MRMSKRVLQFIDLVLKRMHHSHYTYFGVRCTCTYAVCGCSIQLNSANGCVSVCAFVCNIANEVCVQCLYVFKKLPQKCVLVTHGNTTVHLREESRYVVALVTHIKGKFIRLVRLLLTSSSLSSSSSLLQLPKLLFYYYSFLLAAVVVVAFLYSCLDFVCMCTCVYKAHNSYSIHQYSACIR